MSSSQQPAALDDSIVDAVDWHTAIQDFGAQHSMSWTEALRWISNRSSLQVAAEIFGVSLSPSIATRYTQSDREILTGLGDILYNEGYSVPRLMENHRIRYTGKGQTRVGFSLTKEQYLMERADGKSKNRIAREQGISGPALFHWLHKWEINEAAEELRQIEELVAHHREPVARQALHSELDKDIDHSSKSDVAIKNARSHLQMVSDAAPVQKDTQVHHADTWATIQLALPINLLDPDTLTMEGYSDPEQTNRNTMQTALNMLRGAVCKAYGDLSDMLGEQGAREQIQRFVDHQVNTFWSIK